RCCLTQTGSPLPDDAAHLDEGILLALARAFERLEAVVRSIEEVKCRALAELLALQSQKRHVGELVTCAAQEEHRHRDRAEVLRALRFRPPGLMQREGKEDEASHAIEPGFRSSRGGHAPAKRVATCQERKLDSSPLRRSDRRADRRRADLL